MRMRTRKLVGTVALLALVTAWALIAMAVAQFAFRSTNELAAWIFYAVVGLGWVLPAMPLISWMSRPDEGRGDRCLASQHPRPQSTAIVANYLLARRSQDSFETTCRLPTDEVQPLSERPQATRCSGLSPCSIDRRDLPTEKSRMITVVLLWATSAQG